MKRNFLLFIALSMIFSIKAQEFEIYFQFDSYEINTAQQKEIGIFIKNHSNNHLIINGYTDTVGSESYNKRLSDKRVESIYRFVKCINSDFIIITNSFGESESFNPIQNQNRKVIIKHSDNQRTISPIFKEAQIFSINNFADTIIECIEGTKIKILKECFDLLRETIANKQVEFRVTEYYNLNDMLKANLTTTSNGISLETGGMLFIEAFCDEVKCQLKPNRQLGLSFTGVRKDNNMQIFYGEENNNQINWIVSTEEKIVEIVEVENKLFGSEEQVFFIVENMPEFIGGQEGLEKYLKENTKYPIQAFEAKIQGKVFVQFVVETDGSVQDIRVVREVSPSLDYEAHRVVKNMPIWNPGTQRGKAVPVSFTVPIDFNLEKINSIDSTNEIVTYEQMQGLIDFDTNWVAPVTKKESENMTDYFMWTNKMNWINCDKWINMNGKNIFVNVNSKYESIRAIFNNERSIVSAQNFDSKNMKRSFRGLPNDQEIIILGIRHNSEGIYIGMEKVKASNQLIDIEYQKVEEFDFKKLLD